MFTPGFKFLYMAKINDMWGEGYLLCKIDMSQIISYVFLKGKNKDNQK